MKVKDIFKLIEKANKLNRLLFWPTVSAIVKVTDNSDKVEFKTYKEYSSYIREVFLNVYVDEYLNLSVEQCEDWKNCFENGYGFSIAIVRNF